MQLHTFLDMFELLREMGPVWGPLVFFLIVPQLVLAWYRFSYKGARGLLVFYGRWSLVVSIAAIIFLVPYYYWRYRYQGVPGPFKSREIGILVGEVPGDVYREQQVAYAQAIRERVASTPELRNVVHVRLLERPLPDDPERQQSEAIKIGRWTRATFVIRPITVEKVQEPWITIVGRPQFARSEAPLGKFPNAEFPDLDQLRLPRNVLLLARCALALSFYHAHLYVKASQEFQHVLESKVLPGAAPTRPGMYLALGRSLALSGKYIDAAQALGEAVRLRPRFAEAHSGLGFVLESMGLLEEASGEYTKAIDIKPNYAEAHNDLGTDLNLMGRNDEAIDQYERAIALDPNDPHPYSGLCTVFDEEGWYTKAIAECQEAIRLRPNFATAYNELGLALYDVSQCNDAVSEFREVLALGVKDARVYDNLGVALECSDHLDGAISQFKTAIALEPDFAHPYYNLGSALMGKGQYNEAIKNLRRAVFLEPYDPKPRHLLIKATKAAGKQKEDGQARKGN